MTVEYLPDQAAPQVSPAGPLPSSARADTSSGPHRRSLGLRSLTARITAGVLVLVLVLVFAIGAVTYYMLRSSLYSRLDQQVVATSQRNANFFGPRCQMTSDQVIDCPQTNGPPQTTKEWIVLLFPNGSTAATVNQSSNPLFTPLDVSTGLGKRLVDHPGVVYGVDNDGEHLRVTAQQTRVGAYVVTGLSTDDADATLGRLVSLELTIGAAALLVAFLATTYGVQLSLRRLRRVTATAQEVSAELSPEGAGLDRRVPAGDSGSEVGQLAESFNTMLAAVETQFSARVASEQRMRQFLADASHELRTPLTSIRGYAELARMQRTAGGPGVDTTDNLDRIESEGTRMSRLVEDLLMLARGDAGDADEADQLPKRESIDVADLLDDVVVGSRAAFPDRPIDIDVAPAPDVLGDRDQLVRVVRNLVTNAAVHTEAGRPILVRGFAAANGTMITVADGGPGLPPDQAEHVFERFWRADKARTRARGGSGLGMSIVASIVRAHGGTVRFDSTVETGSTVTVWLPPAN